MKIAETQTIQSKAAAIPAQMAIVLLIRDRIDGSFQPPNPAKTEKIIISVTHPHGPGQRVNRVGSINGASIAERMLARITMTRKNRIPKTKYRPATMQQ
jgi:hypothetical protein